MMKYSPFSSVMAPTRWDSTRTLTPARGCSFSSVTFPTSLPVVPASTAGTADTMNSTARTKAQGALRSMGVTLLSGAKEAALASETARAEHGHQLLRGIFRGDGSDVIKLPSFSPVAVGGEMPSVGLECCGVTHGQGR